VSSFTRPLDVRKVGKRLWEVLRSFKYRIGSEDSSVFIRVSKSFVTDFASVPRLFWVILPPDGIYTQAAVLHDFMYSNKSMPRKRCDKIFLEAMEVLDVPKWKRKTMFRAVRMFGGFAWGKKKREY